MLDTHRCFVITIYGKIYEQFQISYLVKFQINLLEGFTILLHRNFNNYAFGSYFEKFDAVGRRSALGPAIQ